MRSKWLNVGLKTVVPLLIGVYLIWYFFDSMSEGVKSQFYTSLSQANYGWIFLSLVLSFASLLSRAYRWKFMLEPLGYPTKFWHRYHAIMIGYIVNLTIPRAGEASRAAMLYRSDGVPFSKSFGTILAERAIDLVLLLSVTLLTISIGYSDFWEIKSRVFSQLGGKEQQSAVGNWMLFAVISLGIIGTITLYFLKALRVKVFQFVKDVFAGVFSIFKSDNPFQYAFHSVFIWTMYVSYFIIAFYSLEQTSEIPLSGMLIAFIAGSLGITFTNGGIGAFPLLVGMVVDFYLADKYGSDAEGLGKAIGMIIWVSQTLMMILLGLLSLWLLPKNYMTDENSSNQG